MTNDEILQAAKEVGAVIDVLMLGRHDNTVFTTGELERFAAAIENIVEKRTIERCANECNKNLIDQITYAEHAAIKKCASAIRKLGEQE